MRKLLLSILLSCLAMLNAHAADCQTYAGITASLPFQHHEFVCNKVFHGYSAAIFTGYKFPSNLKVEGELLFSRTSKNYGKSYYRDSSYLKHTLTQYAILANILYDIDLNCALTPYFGVGCGYTYLKEKREIAHTTTSPHYNPFKRNLNKFIWQGIAGLAYTYDAYTLALDYRRIDTCNTLTSDTINLSLSLSF